MTLRKIAVHIHSDWSDDAKYSLNEIAEIFTARGCHAILLADHDHSLDDQRWSDFKAACSEASDDRILLVPGVEYQDQHNKVHVPVWGLDLPFFGRSLPTLDLLHAVSDAGGLAILAHPRRREAFEAARAEWWPLLSGIEIWNRKYDGISPNRDSAELCSAAGLTPFVSLDFHDKRQLFPLVMQVELAGPCTIESVLRQLRRGQCTAVAFGRPAESFLAGYRGRTAQSLEFARRKSAPVLRGLRGAQ